jgi:TolA-binding protein
METKNTPGQPNQKEGKKNSGLVALLVISLLINAGLLVGVIMFYNKTSELEHQVSQLNGEVTSKDAEVVSKTKELENIKLDLERIREERERLGLENDSMDSQINKLNGYISQLKKTSKLDNGKRKELENLIAELRNQIIEKDEQIASLRTANDSLSTGLSQVSAEKARLGDSLNSTASALAYAAILKAEAVKVVALKENGKEFEGEELKGSKIDRIKVTFALADNKAAKKNRKDFYVALTTPKGEVFSDPNNGGGLLKLADGNDAIYTMNQAIDFTNSNEKLTFTMLKGFNYLPGAYKLDIYSEGYKIGEGSFKVK